MRLNGDVSIGSSLRSRCDESDGCKGEGSDDGDTFFHAFIVSHNAEKFRLTAEKFLVKHIMALHHVRDRE